jgi:hypothetical protein
MKSLKNVWIAFRTTPRELRWIAFGVLIYLLAKIYAFDLIPEIFSRAYEVGKLFQNLGEATLAALIFFVFSYQLPQVIELQRVGPAVYSLVDRVVGRVVIALDRVYRGRPHLPVPETLNLNNVTVDFVRQVFDSVNPNDGSTRLLEMGTGNSVAWIRSLIQANNECRDYIAQVWRYGRFVDAEIGALLSEIEFSGYSGTLRGIEKAPGIMRNPSLSVLADPYFSVFSMAMRLAKCAEKLRTQYAVAKNWGG